MMDAIFSFLGSLLIHVGGAAALVWGVFSVCGRKWVESRFAEKIEAFKAEQQRQLEEVKYTVNSKFSRISKMHDREMEVLPLAWGHLVDARNEISSIVAPLQEYPNLADMDEKYVNHVLSEVYGFNDVKIEHIKNAPNINKEFQDAVFWNDYNKAKKVFVAFHVYVLRNKIFMTKEIKDQFAKADNIMWESLINRKFGKEGVDYKLNAEAYKKIKNDLEQVMNDIESVMQERLRYNDAV